ncbi:hypothetical protein [Poseidonocella sedimentorum]|nr:hypothetical protein [Poseidonocella sedimentorum]
MTGVSERAGHLIAAMAERHVPLTPRLAETLAGLEQAGRPADHPFWGRGFNLAGAAIGLTRVLGASEFWRGASEVFCSNVAEPILRQAAIRTGAVVLSGRAPLPGGKRAPDQHWVSSFESEVDRFLETEAPMGRGFWAESGVALYGAAMKAATDRAIPRGQGRHRPHPVPEPEPLLCHLLYVAEPVLPDDAALKQRLQRSRSNARRKRSGFRPKEGGVNGIRISNRVEDLPDATMSEFFMPPEAIAHRLLHEGILVRNRPPFRQPRRDLLSLCLCDRRAASEATAIVKAAWCDAALRLRIVLSQIGQDKSDLLWSEQTGLGVTSDHLGVENAEFPSGIDALAMKEHVRVSMLSRSGLLPHFADTLASAASPEPTDGPEDAALLARVALARLMALNPLATGARSASELPDYARKLCFVTLTEGTDAATIADEDWPALRTALTAGLAGVLEDRVIPVALIVPRVISDAAHFVAVGELAPGGRLEMTSADPDATGRQWVDEILGALSDCFIRCTIEAIDGRRD